MDVRDIRDELTPVRRAALRSRVLERLGEPRPTPSERVAVATGRLRPPVPLLWRLATIALTVIAIAGGASAASAESLPDDPLYALKLNSEQVRLSLTRSAADRAAVQLGIAETRLREASALAAQDRDTEADAAASAFGEYLANAIASIEEAAPTSADLVEQLRARVARRQADLRIATGAATPNAVTVLASATREIATAGADGSAIADAAARAAEQAASMAKTSVDRDIALSPARTVQETDASRPAFIAQRTLSPEQRARLHAAVSAARDAAERARAAAERAKKAATEKSKHHELRSESDRSGSDEDGDAREEQSHQDSPDR